jgi:hypothetical protein
MATLYIDFTEPSPAPSQYRVRYKQTTDSIWTETTISSPPPFSITGTVATVEYDVEVYSDCGSGVFSSPDTYVAEFSDCQEYTFDNSAGVSLQTISYYECGGSSVSTITSNVSVGSVVTNCVNNAYGIANGYTSGIVPFTAVSGFVLIAGEACTA